MGADEDHTTPTQLPADMPRGRTTSLERAHFAWHVATRGDATTVSARETVRDAVAILVGLVARAARAEEVVVDLTARASALIAGHAAEGRTRVVVDTGAEPDLAALVARVTEAARTARAASDAACILLDVGSQSGPGDEGELLIRLWLADGSVHFAAEYDATVFDHASIERLARCSTRIAEHLSGAPGAAIARIPLLDDAERALILDGFNDTAVARHGEQLMHRLFEAQARRSPDAAAVGIAGRTLSYAALNARANLLAGQLVAHGVGPDQVVGVCIERSPELILALLAILKAGGAFLPIDSDLPRDRARYMLGDTGCTLVLTHAPLLARVDDFVDALEVSRLIVQLDAAAALPDDVPDLATRCQPDDLAYVMYTSGTTGRPKGVLAPHRALCNHALWFTARLGMTPSDRVLQQASMSFDAAMPEVFAPLVSGATVVLAAPGEQRDLLALPALLRRDRITVAQLVPSALRVVAATTEFAEVTSLRYLVSGGEALDSALAAEVCRRLPAVRLGNFYGPTEATVDATSFEVTGVIDEQRTLPIGMPIANSRCRILDPVGALVPIGFPGELHVGGLCLARGYQRLPERTAVRFVDDPFLPGERLYRTGDLARYQADGNIEYLGRIDTQVKLRGYRIEAAEIEAPLLAHPQVAQAAVVLREDTPGDPQLVAYVVAAPEAQLTATDLRTLLRSRLPAYMVPAAFCFLDALPWMTSGKLDRRALPAPPLLVTGPEDSVLLDDPTERKLQQIWERVLGTAPIAADDDFFALGGHSLKAIRLLAEIEQEFGRTLRAATLFDAPTIRTLAARVRDVTPLEPTTIVAVHRGGERTPLFFAPGAGGELFVFDALARALGPDQPLYVLDMYVFDEIQLPVQTITLGDVAARMVADIRRTQPQGPYQLAGYSLGGNIVLEIAQQLRAAGDDVHIVVLLDCDGPGYPLMEPFLTRFGRHIGYALSLSAGAGLRYLRNRLGNMSRFVVGPRETELKLYADQEESHMVPAHVIEALERALGPVLGAWERYVPRFYGGPVLLVRAEIRHRMIGIVDDDPLLGWGPVIGGNIQSAGMSCDHFGMLHAANAAQLAAILTPHLIGLPVAPHGAHASTAALEHAG